MRLDEFLPEYEFCSQHSIGVHATPAEVYDALTALSLSQIPAVRFLMRVRGFSTERPSVTMRESLRRGQFVELCDSPAGEIAYGIVGRFWQPSGGRKAIDSPEQFVAFAQLGYAKAAWNFSFLSSPSPLTLLRTETRIRTYGRSAYWKFRAYWLIVAPFSGLLRRAILQDVKRRAERTHDRTHTSG